MEKEELKYGNLPIEIIEQLEENKKFYESKYPIKNHLPNEIAKRFKTENQWLEEGYVLKENAQPVEMISNLGLYRKTYCYYFDTEVLTFDWQGEFEKCCFSCKYRDKKSYCIVMGNYISLKGYCGEYDKATNMKEIMTQYFRNI